MSIAATVPTEPAASNSASQSLRWWPLLALVVAYWIVRAIAATLLTNVAQFGALFWSPILLALGFFLWLVGFSRLSWAQRGWIALCLVGVGIAMRWAAHPSMGMGLLLFALPVAITSVAVAILLSLGGARALALPLVASVLSWGFFALIRLDGVDGSMGAELSWRWDPTAEDKFLKSLPEAKPESELAAEVEPLVATEADWPEFRGPHRDSRRPGVRIATDWKANPPQEVWRRLIGPGWSSFSVVGDRVYTQDQRGQNEAIVCLSLEDGHDYWVHQDPARFEEVVAGAGPRATPTFHAGRIYALGGSGKLNCLDALSGNVRWTRDLAKDASATPPQWGFASSPLIVEGLAIVIAGGKEGQGALAYDIETGEVQWSGGSGTHSYCSPQLWKIGEIPQVLITSDFGLESFEPASGKLLWSHEWPIQGMARVVQPHAAGEAQLLLGTGYGHGTRLLTLAGGKDATVQEGWTSKDFKPYFNDFVSYEGYAYGFDGDVFCCLDLQSGQRKWKKGRYGHGQVLLLPDQGLLVVISEKGELVLLSADPARHVEHGKLPALPGKTWNHPVVVGDKLLLRNGVEAACYRLPLEN